MKIYAFAPALAALFICEASSAADFNQVFQEEMGHLSPPARGLFIQRANHCLELGPAVRFAVPQYRSLRRQGYTEHQAIASMTSGGPRVATPREAAEIAANAPDGLSLDEIEDRVLRGCLHDLAEQVSR